MASVNTLSYYDFKGKIGAVPVLLNTWFRFDDNNKIVSWDGIIGRFSWLMDTLKPSIGESIANELNISGPDAANYDQLIHQRAALDICSVHQTYCHGQDQQYADYDECIDTILNKKPLGDWWAMGIDNGGFIVSDALYSSWLIYITRSSLPLDPYGHGAVPALSTLSPHRSYWRRHVQSKNSESF